MTWFFCLGVPSWMWFVYTSVKYNKRIRTQYAASDQEPSGKVPWRWVLGEKEKHERIK